MYVSDTFNSRIQKFHDLTVRTSAKKSQKASGLKVKVSCPNEACTLKLTGLAKGSGQKTNRASGSAKVKLKLKQRSATLGAGEKRNVRLKLSGRSLKQLSRLIKKGSKAKATINVRATAPNLDLEAAKVKVKKLTA